jgi:nucleotide-binding universal stress UspA family protein
MNTESAPRRNILVPIDIYGISRRDLETLVRIARQLNRGLLGLLLDDLRLQQAAALPFATEITLGSGQERSLRQERLARQHGVVSDATRTLLHDLAHRDRVDLVFETATGNRLDSALQRDGQLDIFFPARQRWQLLTLTAGAQRQPIRRLGMLLAETAQDQKVLDCATLMQQAGLVGELYVIAGKPLDQSRLDRLYRPGSRICVQGNLRCTPATLTRLIQQSAYDLLLLPGDALKGIEPPVLEAALEKSGSRVLVIN